MKRTEKQKVVILGGCGYIGSKLFTYLTERNYTVDTVDLEWFGNYVNSRNIIADFKDLPKKFFGQYDVVILLAGHSTVGMCQNDVLGSLQNNVENFVTLTQKLRKQKFIYASTYRIYSGTGKEYAKETDRYPIPLSHYDVTKLTIDDYAAFTSLEYYGLRFATVNGYSPNLRVNQIINKLFLEANDSKQLHIFNPHARFSILGIDDLCRAIEQIIIKSDKRGIYNLASFDTTINTITKQLAKIYPNIAISVGNSQGKSHHVCSDTTRFEKTFGFAFSDTLESVILSLEENFSKKSHLLKSL